jgi:hypothetical protein
MDIFLKKHTFTHAECIYVADVVLKANNDYFHIYYYTNKCKYN